MRRPIFQLNPTLLVDSTSSDVVHNEDCTQKARHRLTVVAEVLSITKQNQKEKEKEKENTAQEAQGQGHV